MKKFFKYIKPYWVYFILGPILMISEVLGEVFLPKLMSIIVNTGVLNGDAGVVLKVGLVMVLSAFLMMVCGIGGNYFAAKASISFSADLRMDVFSKIQNFSFKNIDKFSTGSLITRLTNDITQLQNVIRMAMVMLLRSPGMLIGALIMALSINAKLALVIAFVIPLLAISLFLVMKTAFPRFEFMQKMLDKLNSGIQENFTNIRVVKSFVREDYEENKFKKNNTELKESSLRAMNVVILTQPIMMFAMNLTTIFVVWFGGNYVISDGMLIGDLSAFITYITQILMSLMMLSMMILNASRALACAKRVSEVLDEKVDIEDKIGSDSEQIINSGVLEFKNVYFKYNKDSSKYILEDITFTANPGETIGILGPTGSGKTSLVSLIPRLYDVTEGEVLIDGINVKDYTLYNLRNAVGMVLQKNTLFSGTIDENLKWGNENATQEEIISAAENAQAHNFIDGFKDGYETELYQGGSNLSGGQKQRVCIARALLKSPKILILDDSTSAVDTATEAKIRECFKNELSDTTKIIIAQRISSVVSADKIIVLDDGKIVAIGKHDELIENCEEYQEIYYSQRDKEEK